MSWGGCTIDGKNVRFGFADIEDWFNSVIMSFPAPWTIGKGTHYGTEIYDSRGKHIFSVWMAFGRPSAREKGKMTDAEWDEYCCDSHWESETQWHIANAIVASRNYLAPPERGFGFDDRALPILRSLVMQFGRWHDEVADEIACGGPDRRRTAGDPAVRKALHR